MKKITVIAVAVVIIALVLAAEYYILTNAAPSEPDIRIYTQNAE